MKPVNGYIEVERVVFEDVEELKNLPLILPFDSATSPRSLFVYVKILAVSKGCSEEFPPLSYGLVDSRMIECISYVDSSGLSHEKQFVKQQYFVGVS